MERIVVIRAVVGCNDCRPASLMSADVAYCATLGCAMLLSVQMRQAVCDRDRGSRKERDDGNGNTG